MGAIGSTAAHAGEITRGDVERMSRAWDQALVAKDIAALLTLYAPDAVLESPLVRSLLHKKEGVCRGPDQMRPFYERVAEEVAGVSKEARPLHDPDPIIHGRKVIWENPRVRSDGRLSEASSFVEVWEVEGGLIRRHHAYWGWDRMANRERQTTCASPRKPTSEAEAARVYELWDKCVRERDLDGLLALYAEDASIQSPLAATFFGPDRAILRGKAGVEMLLAEALKRRPDDEVHFYRDGFQWNGQTLFWEYPAEMSDGRYQIDLAEVMDLECGLIKRHRIYWGWYGVERLRKSRRKNV
jgi:ketosteroid isomerase-like protein